MSLHDRLFPSERHPDLVQTEWSEGWAHAPAGFGYVAEYLTEHARDFGATIDQAGVAIFFVQRHRVELALKALLDAVGADVPYGHGLKTIWQKCEEALRPKDERAWDGFAADHAELIDALDKVDPGSFAFRYPVDKKGEEVQRPAFIDLKVLHDEAGKLEYGASGYADFLSEVYNP
jgi:HEPN domain-containing protein